MIEARLVVELHGFWHAGTGHGEGPAADAVVAKTPGGLPYLPGKTLKGLVRAATEEAHALGWLQPLGVEGNDLVEWFGKQAPRLRKEEVDDRAAHLEAAEYRHAEGEGRLRFGSPTLGRGADALAWETWARNAGKLENADLLFRRFASTRIDAEGMAAGRTLRLIELAVPVTLHAVVEGPDEGRWRDAIAAALPLVRALGTARNRGLGRVTMTLEEG